MSKNCMFNHLDALKKLWHYDKDSKAIQLGEEWSKKGSVTVYVVQKLKLLYQSAKPALK